MLSPLNSIRFPVIVMPVMNCDLYHFNPTDYDPEYNIVRNEMIGVRHILAIICYTDCTEFCTAFRATYRRMDDETDDAQPTKRHLQFYHFARALFEAAEFFGERMLPEMTLYHGLNKVLYFSKFTEYFKQPISTTPSFQKGICF